MFNNLLKIPIVQYYQKYGIVEPLIRTLSCFSDLVCEHERTTINEKEKHGTLPYCPRTSLHSPMYCLKDGLLACLKRSQALPSWQVYGLIHAFERTINRSYRLQVQTNGCHRIIVDGFFHLSFSSCSNWSNFSRTGCKKSFKSWLIFSLSWWVRSFSSLSLTSNYKVENEQVSC